MSHLTTATQHSAGHSSKHNKVRKRSKRKNWDSAFVDDMILYVKKSKEFKTNQQKNLLEQISEYRKVTEYKIDIQILIKFLCTTTKNV